MNKTAIKITLLIAPLLLASCKTALPDDSYEVNGTVRTIEKCEVVEEEKDFPLHSLIPTMIDNMGTINIVIDKAFIPESLFFEAKDIKKLTKDTVGILYSKMNVASANLELSDAPLSCSLTGLYTYNCQTQLAATTSFSFDQTQYEKFTVVGDVGDVIKYKVTYVDNADVEDKETGEFYFYYLESAPIVQTFIPNSYK